MFVFADNTHFTFNLLRKPASIRMLRYRPFNDGVFGGVFFSADMHFDVIWCQLNNGFIDTRQNAETQAV